MQKVIMLLLEFQGRFISHSYYGNLSLKQVFNFEERIRRGPKSKGSLFINLFIKTNRTGRGISYAQGLKKAIPKGMCDSNISCFVIRSKEATCQAQENAAQSPVQSSMDFTSHPIPQGLELSV